MRLFDHMLPQLFTYPVPDAVVLSAARGQQKFLPFLIAGLTAGAALFGSINNRRAQQEANAAAEAQWELQYQMQQDQNVQAEAARAQQLTIAKWVVGGSLATLALYLIFR